MSATNTSITDWTLTLWAVAICASVLPLCTWVLSSASVNFRTDAIAATFLPPPCGPPRMPSPRAGRTVLTISVTLAVKPANLVSAWAWVISPEASSSAMCVCMSATNTSITDWTLTLWAVAICASVLPLCTWVLSSASVNFKTDAIAVTFLPPPCGPSLTLVIELLSTVTELDLTGCACALPTTPRPMVPIATTIAAPAITFRNCLFMMFPFRCVPGGSEHESDLDVRW